MNILLKGFRIFLAATVLFTVAACGDDDPEINYGGDKGGGNSSTKATSAVARRLEVPELKDGNVFVSHWTKVGGDSVMTYCLEYSPEKYHSRWVAFRFDALTRPKGAGRTDAWSDDPKLPSYLQIGIDYFSGYNRGHICASYDRQYSTEANEQTFYMSNMSPQRGNFNAGLWAELEQYVQNLGRNASFSDTLYVVKGGTIADNQIKGYVSRSRGMKVAVPQYYFMALLKVKNGTYSSIAFWLEHRDYNGDAATDYASHAISVDELETLTGINFFHNLPSVVEDAVEKQCNLSAWNM